MIVQCIIQIFYVTIRGYMVSKGYMAIAMLQLYKEANMKTIVQCNTAKQAGMTAEPTELTIDWTGMTEEGYQAFAAQSLTIKLQANWRKSGIPAKVSVCAADHLPGTRAKAPTLAEMVERAKSNPELKAQLLAMLQA